MNELLASMASLVVLQIKEHVGEIVTLQSDMSPAHRKPLPSIPSMRPEEVPERQREYTKESLLKFKEEKSAMDEAERLAAAGLGEGGFFGGFGGGGDEGEEGDQESDKVEETSTEKSVTKESREPVSSYYTPISGI